MAFAHTYAEIWRLQTCSTIRPLLRAQFFGFPQVRHFWRAPTSGSRQNVILGPLRTAKHRDGEAPNMLHYPPPSKGPMFQFPASKAFLQNPNYWRSQKFYFRAFAHTHMKISRLQMCSTIRPVPEAQYFSFLQVRHFCKTPTGCFPQKFLLGHLLAPTPRGGGSKCAQQSGPL